MNEFVFTKKSEKDFQKLQEKYKARILEKLNFLKSHPNLLSVISPILDMYPITHRVRVGNYRLLLHLKEQNNKNCKFSITQIGHRKDIYK